MEVLFVLLNLEQNIILNRARWNSHFNVGYKLKIVVTCIHSLLQCNKGELGIVFCPILSENFDRLEATRAANNKMSQFAWVVFSHEDNSTAQANDFGVTFMLFLVAYWNYCQWNQGVNRSVEQCVEGGTEVKTNIILLRWYFNNFKEPFRIQQESTAKWHNYCPILQFGETKKKRWELYAGVVVQNIPSNFDKPRTIIFGLRTNA